MSHSPVPDVPSSSGPSSYGGYGGDLQSYGQTAPPGLGPTAPVGHPVPPVHPLLPGPAWPAPQRGLFPPYGAVPPAAVPQLPVRRPVFVGMAATMAVTASLQWICGLAFLWLVATAGARQLGTSGTDGVVFHLLNRFDDRLLDGLAWPLFGFPLASGVAGFLLLTRRGWARLGFTAVGVAAVLWSAWWLRSDLGWWLPAASYVAVAVLLVWMPAVTAWLRQPDASASSPAAQPR